MGIGGNMETSWNVSDYPEPIEKKMKTVHAKVYMTFNLEFEVPEDWEDEDIANDIKENINDFDWCNQEIEDIEL
jgi:hypothetical protein